MPILTLIKGKKKFKLTFSGTPTLREVLESAGHYVAAPCGGRGVCGKCAVRLSGEVSEPDAFESERGTRLICRAVLLGNAVAYLTENDPELAYTEMGIPFAAEGRMAGYGAAIDIGTTTVALLLLDEGGRCIGNASALNPQRAFSSDVIGRIDASLRGKGEELRLLITGCVYDLLKKACDQAEVNMDDVRRMVVTGNTAMLYLLSGMDVSSLARAPFTADHLFGEWVEMFGRRVYLPPAINAFAGADLTCAVNACGMCESSETALFCDLGTNAELALWKEGKLYVTSVAAGPAFEGVEVSCGCGSIPGAVDKVWTESGRIAVHTMGDKPAIGLCGSGLIDAVAAFLELGMIDKTGFSEEELRLCPGVTLLPEDVRSLQQAKAAVAAGVHTLLVRSATRAEQIEHFYLAGGFGSRLNMRSAALIGLVPAALAAKAVPMGNGALTGAVELLLDGGKILSAQAIADSAIHVELGGSADFNEAFIKNLMF